MPKRVKPASVLGRLNAAVARATHPKAPVVDAREVVGPTPFVVPPKVPDVVAVPVEVPPAIRAAPPAPVVVGLLEDAVVTQVGPGKWRVTVATFSPVAGTEKVIEDNVTLPVARHAAIVWRGKHGGLDRNLP